MLVNKTKQAKQHLENLACLPQNATDVEFIYSPAAFKQTIIQLIRSAKMKQDRKFWRNCMVLK